MFNLNKLSADKTLAVGFSINMDQFEIVYLSFFYQKDGSLLIGVETDRRGGGGWVGLNSSNSRLMGICLRIRWHFHD